MRLTLLSLGLAIAAAVFLLMYPLYSGFNPNGDDRQGEAVLFVLAAIAVLLRSSYLASRHRPYRRSLWLAVVLLSISGFLALIARLTSGLHY